jgi:hypothetical protein
MDIDLNLENYDLDDILALFKIKYSFDKADLKKAKRMVLQTHPDKSKLPKEYFLFFSSAYKVLYSIHRFRTRCDAQETTDYVIEQDKEKELLLKDLSKKKNFNKIFNEMFEKHFVPSDGVDGGYGDWLKSKEDIDTRETTRQNMNSTFEQKKRETKELIVHRGIEELGGGGHHDLLDEGPESYGSAIFSSFQYEDLRKAHRESVVPVTNEDFENTKKYNSVVELQKSRTTQDFKPKTYSQSQGLLYAERNKKDIQDVRRAYKLAKQDERIKKTNDDWMSSFKMLTES